MMPVAMSLPRVFVSSTHYDLKHVRAGLDRFIRSLGYEPVLSENGTIPYLPDLAPEDSCYQEAAIADIFVLIIGGRYGSATGGRPSKSGTFHKKYESITKKEYEAAAAHRVPTYILVDRDVYADYETYQKNPKKTSYRPAHVDSVNIFLFIESILSQRGNNPVLTFGALIEIEEWLRKQWAGLFQKLLERRANQIQLDALSTQVQELEALSRSFKAYLETIVSKVAPKTSEGIIETEEAKLRELTCYRRFVAHPFLGKLSRITEKSLEELFSLLRNVDSGADFIKGAFAIEGRRKVFSELMRPGEQIFIRINELRDELGLKRFTPIGDK